MDGASLQQEQPHSTVPTRMNAVNAWMQNKLRQQAPEAVAPPQTATMDAQFTLVFEQRTARLAREEAELRAHCLLYTSDAADE